MRPKFLDRLLRCEPVIAAFERELDSRLAARKALRQRRSQAAVRGWHTRRANHV